MCSISFNDRDGVAAINGSVLTLQDCNFSGTGIDLDASGGTFVDAGGNYCWTGSDAPNCKAQTGSPMPPTPPTP